MNSYTDFLCGQPSMLTAIGSVMDIGGTALAFNDSPSPEIADQLAIMSDWMTVGNDMRVAIGQFQSECPEVRRHDDQGDQG